MSCHDRWRSKADILEDLAEVTGQYTDVEEKYVVVGEGPPPVRRMEDDEEFNLRFSAADDPNVIHFENNGPDLKGITQMLRMVDEFDRPSDTVTCVPNIQSDFTLTISKLDPNVPEFVPKCANNSSPSINVNVSDKQCKNENNNNNSSKNRTHNGKSDINDSSNDGIDKRNPSKEEIEVISTQLRKKIIDVSAKEDLHAKKEKNVAIAALLKLYTTPRSEEEKPIKLMTPSYFVSAPAAAVPVDDSESTSNADASPAELESSTLESSSRSGRTSPKSESDPPHVMDPNIQKSINKVNDWLHKPESPKPKGPTLSLGPIYFKKKNSGKSSDDSRSSSSSTVNLTPSLDISFKPSKLAEDLTKEYNQRAKASEKREATSRDDNIWDVAMRKMKEKERKQIEQSCLSVKLPDDGTSS
ncbi:probable serine/threonine-protein kinase nek3 [Ostrinia furnacalis]|uniref:probable serine/threonine-protein kinase nek3 n=1 Tax=Ostrinia furnacalis TaxID=93504 RepID=UPI00103E3B7F|nr:probable serine/threonine-protein kinase nek3 [Ostrinia furnacalis]XP_028157844.1 probable serine/threonine-protein kinase nek3 [Ostrinia furnacalis]XP_028157845.1 probable serine/threonine-protein kinase nek3 [Ostrinia furnacalis]